MTSHAAAACQPLTPDLSHLPDLPGLAADTTATCARIVRDGGCLIRSAHVHTGAAVVQVDRRPALADLVPACLRCDSNGRDYRARVDGVVVEWHEPPRGRRMAGGAA